MCRQENDGGSSGIGGTEITEKGCMTYGEFCSSFHIRLNAQQMDAVRSIEGPVLLLAVPGSGKTTVLVTRLGYMVYCAGIAPEHILTLTYTVAAARDMEARFCSYFGSGFSRRLEFRTINGICAKIIHYFGERVGRKPFSLVTEEGLIRQMLSDIFRKVEGGYATESDLKGISAEITYIKNRMLTDAQMERREKEADFKIAEIYREYNRELRAGGLMDYDDQMVYAYNILRKSAETLRHFQNRYTYICVDEAQDTSKIQHEIIRLLASGRDNLFMVGDEDQSIYGFRAAYPEALLSFEKEHPGATVLLMEENFRSNAKIVAAAQRFIQKNALRHEKQMTAARKAGAEVQGIRLRSREGQYDYLVKVAKAPKAQTAVLYRNNESVLPLVDRLERLGIPYRLHKAEQTFFTHRTVQDIRNILSFAVNQTDTDLFLQIYYKVSTYLRKQDALRVCERSRKTKRDILETAIDDDQIPLQTRQSCGRIRNHLKGMLQERGDRAINRIVAEMGYGGYMCRMGFGDGKLFCLKAIAQYENSAERVVKRLEELQELVSGSGKDWTDNGSCRGLEETAGTLLGQMECELGGAPIILSTIHSSKGLEYDTVYLVDVVDGVFPESMPGNLNKMDKEEREAYEEERRLFYVGVTRARNRLFLFQLNQRCSFCEEVVSHSKRTGEQTLQAGGFQAGKSRFVQAYAGKKEVFARTGYEEYVERISAGLAVRHKKWGEGVVEEVKGGQAVLRFGQRQRLVELRILYEHDLLLF